MGMPLRLLRRPRALAGVALGVPPGRESDVREEMEREDRKGNYEAVPSPEGKDVAEQQYGTAKHRA